MSIIQQLADIILMIVYKGKSDVHYDRGILSISSDSVEEYSELLYKLKGRSINLNPELESIVPILVKIAENFDEITCATEEVVDLFHDQLQSKMKTTMVEWKPKYNIKNSKITYTIRNPIDNYNMNRISIMSYDPYVNEIAANSITNCKQLTILAKFAHMYCHLDIKKVRVMYVNTMSIENCLQNCKWTHVEFLCDYYPENHPDFEISETLLSIKPDFIAKHFESQLELNGRNFANRRFARMKPVAF